MILHTVFITHNRLQLTKQAISSYLETVTLPYSYLVVDNASSDGTQEWLRRRGHPHLLLEQNFYPGYATNRGWELAPSEATHLQRADNDMRFLPGWSEEVELRFLQKHRTLGQLGLRTRAEEFNCRHNTGGNCVIRADLFRRGLRYDERPWTQYHPGTSEDSLFSPAVRRLRSNWARVQVPCLESLASGDWEDPYYQRSYGDRRILRPEGKRYGTH
jgi:glycosyltransferase involved in cell wall biosynthesis